jgi:D-aminoacyl-tRNA deacylase
MKAVIQRVSRATVEVEGKPIAQIGRGFLVLWGIAQGDTQAMAEQLVKKIVQMRIFPDADGKMNRSLIDTSYDLLLVSQFTLLADTRKGNRPSFTRAAPPAEAIPLYEHSITLFEKYLGKSIQKGIFGADMQVSLCNDGPVTICLDTHEP